MRRRWAKPEGVRRGFWFDSDTKCTRCFPRSTAGNGEHEVGFKRCHRWQTSLERVRALEWAAPLWAGEGWAQPNVATLPPRGLWKWRWWWAAGAEQTRAARPPRLA